MEEEGVQLVQVGGMGDGEEGVQLMQVGGMGDGGANAGRKDGRWRCS